MSDTTTPGGAMSVWDGPPLDLSKYTDSELERKLADVKEDIAECVAMENWKKSLIGQEHWIEWELGRREAQEPSK